MAIGYKLFRTKNGKLYPLYVLANKETPVGEWIEAECGEMSEKEFRMYHISIPYIMERNI